jgi:hypothetical protein
MMNPEDVGKVLAVAAMYDRRKVGKTDILAWADSLDGQDPKACAEAIRAHYTDPDTCSQYLLPGHVLGRIRAQRRANAERAKNDTQLRAIEGAKAEHDPTASHRRYLEASRMVAEARARKAARSCADCGGSGWIEPADGSAPIACNHGIAESA